MVNTRKTERSSLLPTQSTQRDCYTCYQQGLLEHKSTTPHTARYCGQCPGAANPLAYRPTAWGKSSATRGRLLYWLLLPPVLLSLALSGYLIRICRGAHADVLQQLSARPVDPDNYDSGAPFAPLATQKLWAAYSPYSSVGAYKPPPEDCQVTQVNILQRHGARYPTFGLSIQIAQALLRLQSADSYLDERLKFITDYKYNLGIDDLLPFGAFQTSESGRKSFVRYPTLADEDNLPFVRASGSERVIESAFKWIKGFATGSGDILHAPLALVIPETDNYNNTLEDKSCPNVGHPLGQVQEWQSRYAQPIADRLNIAAQGMPENVTAEGAQALIALCALETLAVEEYSPFCDLFSKEEFEGFEYSMDLDKFYFTGHGSPLGPVQGVGYVNELLARLTDQPVQDHTQTNQTLDSNPDTFPLGRGIYADFSHDNLIVAVISAMGLFNGYQTKHTSSAGGLDPTRQDKSRVWFLSRIVPFSGRMVVERMECGLQLNDDAAGRSISVDAKERQHRRAERNDSVYVRILMNDAVQDLEFCEGADKDGLCPLHAFIRSQAYARENGQGDWEKCFK
ncbi:phosphoglycerate mutase-like protein [Macrolepiota fuliginosa MF-IS2]|uniref:Phosphoglycerate mutase-like protein n=1 Tax=Macrolepiota fuliginosa MF-IS2 TaxID=1400762 RepID=A0A9P5X7A5_9AGAR|nr:phosphoglycerate mutase-like protein [Macrolepiota fuliginosa MF-IS2]